MFITTGIEFLSSIKLGFVYSESFDIWLVCWDWFSVEPEDPLSEGWKECSEEDKSGKSNPDPFDPSKEEMLELLPSS